MARWLQRAGRGDGAAAMMERLVKVLGCVGAARAWREAERTRATRRDKEAVASSAHRTERSDAPSQYAERVGRMPV